MPTFTVHAPPRSDGEPASPERFLFVRDGFHGWAFLFGPFWLIRYRLWLALMIYAIVMVALIVGLTTLRASATAQTFALFVVALLIGFEAASIRRWTLARRGWATLGFVVGDDRDIAEHRFFTQWADRDQSAPPPAAKEPPPSIATPVRRGPPSGRDVIGLFPEPEQTR
jgi:hypothetical protein